MITAQVEKFSDIAEEVKELLALHWVDLALNKDKVALEPQYDVYLKKEQSGELFIVTVRLDGKIIGYYCGFIGRSLHYKSMLTCLPDIYYVHPDYRDATTGLRLFSFVKAELKRRGVMYWVVGDKNHKPVGPFFERLGFNKIENYYSMWIGE